MSISRLHVWYSATHFASVYRNFYIIVHQPFVLTLTSPTYMIMKIQPMLSIMPYDGMVSCYDKESITLDHNKNVDI